MSRQRFVWEIHLRREALDDELARLRDLPYSVWRDLINSPMSRTLTARDGTAYRVDLSADWVYQGSTDIRVMLTLRPLRGWRRRPLSESFVITPESRFVA